ncbi:MAG: efflux RND transporter periplasmic adaptor subunit [Planctomycetes bacterium]|nr:efflux RND transporter periplasmic adaptor subunit [Planctomycetota bacterium]
MQILLRRLFILLLFGLLVLALLKFQGKVFRTEHPAHALPELPAVPEGAQTAIAKRTSLPQLQVYPGFVEPVDPAQISSRVMATVLSVSAREGDAVEDGQVLVQLDDQAARARLAQTRANLQTAQAQELQAKLAFERAQRLHDAQALTAQEWESARANRDATKAMAEQAQDAIVEAENALSWHQIPAPFAGQILERHTDPGSLASPGQPLAVMYRPDDLRFSVAVPESLAADLKVGQTLKVRFGDSELSPSLTRILPGADPRTGTVTLQLGLPTSSGLLPGMLGRLTLSVGEREALVIPEACLRRVGQIERVSLVKDGRISTITVRSGKNLGGMVEILSGLSEGEEVLVP